MLNNDILSSLRYTFNYSDAKMIEIFALANCEVTRHIVCNWLKKEDVHEFQPINDEFMATFLNGFINEKRGRKEGPLHPPEKTINNNIIFRKLKIALNLKDENILEILDLANFRISKHELSAFFRNPTQEQYRECKDQVMRNFLHGVQIKYHDNVPETKAK